MDSKPTDNSQSQKIIWVKTELSAEGDPEDAQKKAFFQLSLKTTRSKNGQHFTQTESPVWSRTRSTQAITIAWAKWSSTAKRLVLRIWQLHYLCFEDFTLLRITAWSHWLLGLVFCLCLTHSETVCMLWDCSMIKTKVRYAGVTETSSSQIFSDFFRFFFTETVQGCSWSKLSR